jgi:hypothetical protein
MVVCGLLEAALAGGLFGSKAAEGAAYSIILCILPGWLTIFAVDRVKHPDMKAYAVLIGTGLRMAFVLAGYLAIGSLRSDLGFREFTIWLIPGYLVALALETWLVLNSSNSEVAR